MQPPFFGFRFKVGCKFPSVNPREMRGHQAGSVDVLRYADDSVVRSALPEPIGRRFGIVAKTLLALAKCLFGALAVLDIGRRSIPFDDVARLIPQRLGVEPKPTIFTVEAPETGF